MPAAAPRPCSHPGCGVLVRDGRPHCERHRAQRQREQDARRGNAHQRLYTRRWREAAAAYLRVHPLCAQHMAAGHVEPAAVVDHKVPHRGDRTLFWDSRNWQALCVTCHNRKTATKDGGFGRSSIGEGASDPWD